jgi:uncharacterized protein with HEPN domain
MTKQPNILFEHMLRAITQIEKYIEDLNEQSFKEDAKTVDAVIRQLAILGEAASGIPANLVKNSPIPWKMIVGMRNKLIHDYMGIDTELVWDTVSKQLKPLKKYIQNKL